MSKSLGVTGHGEPITMPKEKTFVSMCIRCNQPSCIMVSGIGDMCQGHFDEWYRKELNADESPRKFNFKK